MNYKRFTGFIFLFIGIGLLIYGIYGSYRLIEAKKDVDRKTKYLPGEGFRGYVQETFYGEVDQYKLPVTLCYIGGVAFLVGSYFFLRRRKR